MSAADLQVSIRPLDQLARQDTEANPCGGQRRHAELEGAPDPFPSLVETPVKARPAAAANNGAPEIDSAVAFPSLAPAAPAVKAPASAWSAPRIKATASKQPLFSDSLTTPVVDLSTAGRDGKPTSLGEIMRQIMAQYKVKLDASTNQKLRQTTFFLKSEHKKDLEKAKKALLASLSPVVSSHAWMLARPLCSQRVRLLSF